MSFSCLTLGLICNWQTEVDVVCRTGSIINYCCKGRICYPEGEGAVIHDSLLQVSIFCIRVVHKKMEEV